MELEVRRWQETFDERIFVSNGLLIWLDSGANIHSNNKQELTWDELGITEEEWDEKTEEEQEAFAKDIAFAYADWGYKKR